MKWKKWTSKPFLFVSSSSPLFYYNLNDKFQAVCVVIYMKWNQRQKEKKLIWLAVWIRNQLGKKS